jgi:phosphate-selective porin OprO and OprP
MSKTHRLTITLAVWSTTCLLATCIPAAAQSDPPKTKKDKQAREQVFEWDDHPSLNFGKGTRIDFRARLAGELRDSEAPFDNDDATDSLDIAKRRLGVAGQIRNIVDFQVEAEVGSSNVWRDVYVNYRQFDFVQVQGGKFKLPFSLDENTSATNLDFVNRSRAANQLAPGRDIGVMVHGRLFRRVLGYEVGVFNRDGDNARTADSDRVHGEQTFAARATVQPFRQTDSLLKDIQVGVAMTRSDLAEGYPDLRGRTALDMRFFQADAWVMGARKRHGFEVRWRPGPASIKAEWMRVSDERLEQGVDDGTLSPLLGTGWYISGTWALTGEHKAGRVDNPRRPLFRGGYGAVEVAARIEKIAYGSKDNDEAPSDGPRANVIRGNSDRVDTFGVNWYPMRWIKVQFNVVRDTLADPNQGPLPAQPSFWSRVFRFQVSL